MIDCPAGEMWADILTKLLPGMGFRTMRDQKKNCPINYKDSEEEQTKQNLKTVIIAEKLVTWKGMEWMPSRTPQEYVGKNK